MQIKLCKNYIRLFGTDCKSAPAKSGTACEEQIRASEESDIVSTDCKSALALAKSKSAPANLLASAILTLLLLLVPMAISAQEQTLNLQQTIRLAVDSSLQSFRARNLYRAGYWEFQSYKASQLPALSLQSTPLRYNHDIVSRYDSENNIDIYRRQQSLYSYANLSLSQQVGFTGGTLFMDSELGFFRNFGTNTYSQFSSVPIRIGYAQSLFGFNAYKWERKIEPLKYEKAKKEFLYSCEQISETAIRYFFSLAVAQMEYELALNNVATTDSLHRIGEERIKIAAISQADLLTLRLDALNAKNTLKTAELDIKRAMFNFASFLNLEKDTEIKLILPEKLSDIALVADEVLGLARSNNPDYLQYKKDMLEAERNLDQTIRKSRFDASVSASIGFNQVAETVAGAYQKPLQQDVLRIGLNVPLVDWGVRKGRVNMARSNLDVARISTQQAETQLEQDVVLTVGDFEVQKGLIASAQEADKLANLAYNTTKQRFIIGRADVNSLTLSLNRLNVARKNYLMALQNYWLSYYKLRKLTLHDFESNTSLSAKFDELMQIKK